MQRCFLAIQCSPGARTAVAEAQARVREQLRHSRVTWVAPENFHITLHFFGDVDKEKIQRLVEELCAKEYPRAFELRLQDVAAFPNGKRPRTLFVRTIMPTELLGLRKRTADVIAGFNLPIDQRPWDSHITIGRVQVQSETLKPDEIAVDPIAWRVESFDLMSSVLTPNGSIYTRIESLLLTG